MFFFQCHLHFDRSAFVNAVKLYKNEKQVTSHLMFTVDLYAKQDAKLVSSKVNCKVQLSSGGSVSWIWHFSSVQG